MPPAFRALARRALPGALLALAVVAAAMASPTWAKTHVAVYMTTADLKSRLARRHDVAFRSGTPTGADAISVDPKTRYQRLTAGFGLAMTDTSAYMLDRK